MPQAAGLGRHGCKRFRVRRIIFDLLRQIPGFEIFFEYHFRCAPAGQGIGIQRLMIIRCKREGDKNYRFPQSRHLGHRCGTGPAYNQIGLFIERGHLAEKCLDSGRNALALIGFQYHFFVGRAGLMDKIQVVFPR